MSLQNCSAGKRICVVCLMTKDKSIFIKNIYYMLSYAFQVLKQSNYDDVKSEKFDQAQDLFAAILSKGVAQQLKQGLYREYITKHTGNVAGILLYAKTDEPITPDCMFNMGGNQIGAKTLDLNVDFKVIAAQLDKIAEDFFQVKAA